MRFRYDKDMDCIVEIREGSNYFEDKPPAPAVISDLAPYRAAGSDIACGGRRPVIGGRRQHREFLRRNGYVEVGNERAPSRGDLPAPREAQRSRVEDIKRALGEYGSNTGARR